MKPYYSEAGIEIYHGDCREVLRYVGIIVDGQVGIPLDALVCMDPPYGISHETSHGASWEGTQIANDSTTELRDWLVAALQPRDMIVFGSWKALRPTGMKAMLIWDKGPAFGMGDLSFPWKNSFEEIYVYGRGFAGRRDEGVLRGHIVPSWESNGRLHPHEKPVSLWQHFISKHKAGFVFDPTCGTGTSLAAAKVEGRRAVGIELEESYCEIAANRLRQGVLFGAAG